VSLPWQVSTFPYPTAFKNQLQYARVVKLVNTPVFQTVASKHVGSSPTTGINLFMPKLGSFVNDFVDNPLDLSLLFFQDIAP
jgi:hypothetical protein